MIAGGFYDCYLVLQDPSLKQVTIFNIFDTNRIYNDTLVSRLFVLCNLAVYLIRDRCSSCSPAYNKHLMTIILSISLREDIIK